MSKMKFPRMHIAESVANRILNLHDELMKGAAQALDIPIDEEPAIEDPAIEGAALNDELASHVPPVAATDDPTGALSAVTTGTNLLDQA